MSGLPSPPPRLVNSQTQFLHPQLIPLQWRQDASPRQHPGGVGDLRHFPSVQICTGHKARVLVFMGSSNLWGDMLNMTKTPGKHCYLDKVV